MQHDPPSSFAENIDRMPEDLGLTHLGLLMQLGGGLLLILQLYLVISVLPALQHGWPVLIIGTLGVVRSAVHLAAGLELSSGSGQAPSRVRAYLVVAGLHTVVTLVVFFVLAKGLLRGGPGLVFGLAAALLAWPAALLLLMSRGRVRALYAAVNSGQAALRTADNGITGAGVLMTGLGIMGVILGALLLYVLLAGGVAKAGFPGIAMILAGLGLLIRSAVHVSAGVRGMRGPPMHDFVEGVRGYRGMAWIAIALVGLALFATLARLRRFPPTAILSLALVGAALALWPLIVGAFVRRAFADAHWTDDLEPRSDIDEAPARDRGLTAVGYALVAQGAIGAGWWILARTSFGRLIPFYDRLARQLESQAQVWIGLLLVVLALWAGFEIVRMSPLRRLAGVVYGISASVWSVYGLIESLDVLKKLLGRMGDRTPMVVVFVGSAAAALVVPLMTLVLVLRRETGGPERLPPGRGHDSAEPRLVG